MDTRFWGPSGWQLIHLVAADTLSPQRRVAVLEWFHLLEYILPCKYCRASFHDYLQAQPLTSHTMATPDSFGRWAYEIHNRVNGKLRGQGLLTTPDPSWPEVQRRIMQQHKGLCKGSPLLGWDFMTSVAFSTPGADYVPTPMPDYDGEPALDPATRNRYNLMTRAERLPYLARWWALIPSILPCAAWRSAWGAALRRAGQPPLARGRNAVMRWMWRIEEAVCSGLRCPTPHESLRALQAEVGAFESGCGKARAGKTCRTLKVDRRNRVRTQRRRRGVDVL